MCMFVIPAVPYLSTELAGCSVGSEISCVARKLTRIPRVTHTYFYKNKWGWPLINIYKEWCEMSFIESIIHSPNMLKVVP